MSKLDESDIIKIFQRKLGNARICFEDVEMFSIWQKQHHSQNRHTCSEH